MTKYEKIKLIVLCFTATFFSVLLYLNSLNGRYVMHPNKRVMIDSRNGDIYDMIKKSKPN